MDEQIWDKIEQKALAFCRGRGLFLPRDRVIAACSGGADSMALLLFLLRCAETLNITVEACHVNHALRGEAADQDEAFVAAFCAEHGVTLHRFSPESAGIPVPPNPGEDWARKLRYACFARLTGEREGVRVATAHTLSDQSETVLFRMARGTGVHGMAGIPVRRGALVRPLLCLSRAETEAYCAALGQNFVTDETNLGDAYARNRIRHHALPALCAANPAAERAIGRLCEKMSALDDYFCQKAEALLAAAHEEESPAHTVWRLQPLQNADAPVLEWALHALVEQERDPEEKYIRLLEKIVRKGSGGVQLRPGVRFLASGDFLHRERACGTVEKQCPALWEMPFQPGVYTLPGGYMVEASVEKYEKKEKNEPVHKKDLKYLADYAKIQNNILLRNRRPGDCFAPAGRGVTKSLKKFLNEAEIPQAERAKLPMLAAKERVLWLWGCGFSEDVAPGPETTAVLCIKEKRKGV